MRLSLFFTEGVSLQTWQQVGMLDRELALYRAFLERGAEVEFITYGGRADRELGRHLPGIKVHTNQFDLPRSWYAHLVPWKLHGGPGSVYKSNQVAGAELGLKAARQKGTQFVARCGYLLSDFTQRRQGRDSVEFRQAQQMEQNVFGHADRVVVTTQAMKTTVVEDYQVPEEKITVIPNYVQTEVFRPAKPPDNPLPKVGFVGRLEAQKNLRTLMDAIRPLELELVLVGDGSQHEELLAHSHGAKATVRFLGNRPNRELPELMCNWDLFVLPSLYEGHPKALLEAMACGLPVIGSDAPGIRELIRHHHNGLLCAPTIESIRDAVETLLADADLRRRLGANARTFIVENFALDKVADMEWALLSELVG